MARFWSLAAALVTLIGCTPATSKGPTLGSSADAGNQDAAARPSPANVCRDEGKPGCEPCLDTSDCRSEYAKCNRHGICVSTVWCERDADCTNSRPVCAVVPQVGNGTCQICVSDRDCPAERPYCLANNENLIGCSPWPRECTAGNPVNTCAAGTWCTQDSSLGAVSDHCLQADCHVNLANSACQACLWYSAEPCLRAGGSCTPQVQALCDCMTRNGVECLTPPQLTTINSGLTFGCHAASIAVHDCVKRCPASVAACGVPLFPADAAAHD